MPATLEILIDFPAGDVRAYAGEPYGFRFDIDRSLVEKVVAERAVDWSNSLFLSCRFRAWRQGEFNEYVYNFFKSLSPGRMRRTEAEALRKLHPPTETEPDIELDGWVMQRRCPHRNADLSVFGEVDGCELVCTLHGWRFDLETGKCLTSAGHDLRVAPRRRRRRLSRGARVCWLSRSATRQLAPWTQTGMCIGMMFVLPDEVHRRDRHPHAAVRRRVVGHVVGAVHGLPAAEVLRPVDPPEVAFPPADRTLAVHLVQAVARDRHARLHLARGVLVGLLVRLPVAGRRVVAPTPCARRGR